jgi:hypothetical protein
MKWRKRIAQWLDPPPPPPPPEPEPPWPPVVISDYPYQPESRYGHGRPSHALLHQILDADRQHYRAVLEGIRELEPYFLEVALDEPAPPEPPAPESAEAELPAAAAEPAPPLTDPVWRNPFLPGYDAAALWWFLKQERPHLYLEVGSGNSTRFARHVVRRHNLPTRIVSIDPHPRAAIDALCDEVIRQPVERVDLEIFDQLRRGDILFLDHSHRAFMGSDATVTFLDILPRLQPGVLVQIHDIYLPWDYPPDWTDRYFNEQYLLACMLLAPQPPFDVELPVVFTSTDPDLREILKPLWTLPYFGEIGVHGVPQFAEHGVSFWLRWKGRVR